MRKVDLNCLLYKGCVLGKKCKSFLVYCYVLARDICWSKAILYSTRFTSSFRVSWFRWWELDGGSYNEIRKETP